jgi:hypothetical protein
MLRPEGLQAIECLAEEYMMVLENRLFGHPAIRKMQRIADTLGVTVNYLLAGAQADEEYADRSMMFFHRYRGLSDEKQERARQFVEKLEQED